MSVSLQRDRALAAGRVKGGAQSRRRRTGPASLPAPRRLRRLPASEHFVRDVYPIRLSRPLIKHRSSLSSSVSPTRLRCLGEEPPGRIRGVTTPAKRRAQSGHLIERPSTEMLTVLLVLQGGNYEAVGWPQKNGAASHSDGPSRRLKPRATGSSSPASLRPAVRPESRSATRRRRR